MKLYGKRQDSGPGLFGSEDSSGLWQDIKMQEAVGEAAMQARRTSTWDRK